MQRKTPPPSRPLLVAWAPFSPTLVEVGSLEGGLVVIPKSTITNGYHNRDSATLPLPDHRFLIIAGHGGHPQELLEEEVAAIRGLEGYLLVITGKREKLADRIAKLDPPSNVVYPGYLDDADYEALKRSADVALSLSTEINTVPHAIHEYLAYGIPTIVLKDSLLRSPCDITIV